MPINYFILRGEPLPVHEEDFAIDDVSNLNVSSLNAKPPLANLMKLIPTVHEQEDGVIFSLCATGMSSKDSLLSWIRHLEKDGNENLIEIPVVFTLRTGVKEISNTKEEINDEQKLTDT